MASISPRDLSFQFTYSSMVYPSDVTTAMFLETLGSREHDLQIYSIAQCKSLTAGKLIFFWDHFTDLYYISGDCALIPRQSTNCNQKHGGFWPNLRHFDVTVSLFSCRTPLTRYLSGKNLSMSRGQWMAP